MGYIIYNDDCLNIMRNMESECIDLTVTSPPYDNLRTYNGNIKEWNFEKFKNISKELYRITKIGGVVVWIVGDATINGDETGSSFKQALYFKDIGFKLHDTMIFKKKELGHAVVIIAIGNRLNICLSFQKEDQKQSID